MVLLFMKPIKLSEFDSILLRKRSLIETVFDQLKNISQVEHSRHRSFIGFIINLLASVISYTWQPFGKLRASPKKPSLNLRSASSNALVVLDNSLYTSEFSFTLFSYVELTLNYSCFDM